MVISLDYDNTYSCDRELWWQVVKLAQARGHTVICVSGRDNVPLHRDALTKDLPPGLPIILCDHLLKRAAAEKQGWKIDVWIDDTPEGIGESRGGS